MEDQYVRLVDFLVGWKGMVLSRALDESHSGVKQKLTNFCFGLM